MSSKYNHLLLSACLPVMAMAVCLPTPAFAGFEWTPPEETVPAPLPLETLEPTPPQPVLSEPLPELEMDVVEETAEPAIQIKVLDDDEDNAETDKKVDEAIENAIDMGDVDLDKPVEETITIELEDEVEVIPTEVKTDMTAEDIIETPQNVEVTVDVTEDAPAPQQSTSLSINPYPLEEGNAATPKTETPIVLPADSDKDLGELTAEDVNLTTTEAEEAPAAKQEKIFWNETETFDVIEGFGKDMPLALALRQIVPAQYAFSFGKDVNPGAAISWTGGQPWNSVLTAALAPLNVKFELDNKKILLRSADAMPTVKNTSPVEVEKDTPSLVQEASIEDTMDEVIAAEAEQTILAMPETKAKVSETIIIEDVNTGHAQSADISTPAQNIETEALQETVDMAAETAPLDIVETVKEAETVEDIVAPLEPILKVDDTVEEISIKRNNIQDPGEMATEQPVIIEQSEGAALLEEKKNEVVLSNANTLPTDITTIDYTKAALKQMSAQAVALNTPAETQDQTSEGIIPEAQTSETITIQDVAALDTPVIIVHDQAESSALDDIMPAETTASDVLTSSSFRMAPSDTIQIWEAGRKSNLQKILRQWSEKEDVELVWNASENYVLDKDIFISGTFKNAVDILFSKGLKNPPKHILAQAPSYNLRIEDSQ